MTSAVVEARKPDPDEQNTDVRRVLNERRADIAMSNAIIPGGVSRAA